MSELTPDWLDWTCDGRGWYLVNDPEITFYSEEEAMAYCDEHNRELAGKAVIRERERITGIIEDRLKTHKGFVNGCLDAGVEPAESIFTAMAELSAILRKIEQ